MTTTGEVLSAEVVNIVDDDDDEISPLYANGTGSTTSLHGRNRRGASGTDANNAISVEKYSEDRDLQLAILASLSATAGGGWGGSCKCSTTKRTTFDLSGYCPPDDDDNGLDDEVQILLSFTPKLSRRILNQNRNQNQDQDCGANGKAHVFGDPWESPSSSNSYPDFTCEICCESKPWKDSFSIMGCSHFYCSECMVRYVASCLQDNIAHIGCPVSGCEGLLEPHHCRSILPSEVFDRWGNALCEALIMASEKFYCPFNDCSALLIDDSCAIVLGERGEVITQSECPDCHRLFCAQCKVPWHSGIDCGAFQKLNMDEREREDIMLMQLAKNRNWMRCPNCRFYVERSSGCLFMRCRCGHCFCYNCGDHLEGHYCVNCKR